jgi:preprotein translocase subunit SecE
VSGVRVAPPVPKEVNNMFKKIKNYFSESYDELRNKVSWPTFSELQNSAIVVSVASLIIALVVLLMDLTFSNLLKEFYKLF